MSERLAHDIARDLRTPGPWPSERLLCEAADKMEGLIEALANAERERDDARRACKRYREELERLRTGETCQVGQPAACGDYHNAGQCVRPIERGQR